MRKRIGVLATVAVVAALLLALKCSTPRVTEDAAIEATETTVLELSAAILVAETEAPIPVIVSDEPPATITDEPTAEKPQPHRQPSRES